MTRPFRAALLILCVLTASAYAQTNYIRSSFDSSDVRLPVNNGLKKFGIAFYEFKQLGSDRVGADLFDPAGFLVAKVLMKRDKTNTFYYSIKRTGHREVSVKVTTTESKEGAWFEAIASSGQRIPSFISSGFGGIQIITALQKRQNYLR